MSVDDGARKSNNWLDQWQSDKLDIRTRVQSFSRAFPSSNDVPVLLLNQPSVRINGVSVFPSGIHTVPTRVAVSDSE